MLVVTRIKGEQLFIGEPGQTLTEPIVVTIAELRSGGRVRVGVKAQKDMPIHRDHPRSKGEPNDK